jgi:hypothetical protein
VLERGQASDVPVPDGRGPACAGIPARLWTAHSSPPVTTKVLRNPVLRQCLIRGSSSRASASNGSIGGVGAPPPHLRGSGQFPASSVPSKAHRFRPRVVQRSHETETDRTGPNRSGHGKPPQYAPSCLSLKAPPPPGTSATASCHGNSSVRQRADLAWPAASWSGWPLPWSGCGSGGKCRLPVGTLLPGRVKTPGSENL